MIFIEKNFNRKVKNCPDFEQNSEKISKYRESAICNLKNGDGFVKLFACYRILLSGN